ncbi:hypothetical protein LC653_44835, partial [Nostoc sp. CHAB 5784]|uniref:hypothetical protein n=1 Tax=Nostoc mirabile TaxID=2907820 RepID=UPI001E337B53
MIPTVIAPHPANRRFVSPPACGEAGWFHTKKEKYISLDFSFCDIAFYPTSIPLPEAERGFETQF